MAKLSKNRKAAQGKLEPNKQYVVEDEFKLLKQVSFAKFDETVEASVNLGVDPRKSDQVVRGATVLPRGTGKEVRVAVFTQGEKAEAAQAAGADIVGFEELADEVKGGRLDFDVVVATPDAMRVVGKLGPILGPRGLMPNPKTGTVTPDVVTAIKNAKAGQVRYRTDRAGIVHAPIGKVSFDVDALTENLNALLAALNKAKPSAAKGVYIQKVSVASTMGPGLAVDKASLPV